MAHESALQQDWATTPVRIPITPTAAVTIRPPITIEATTPTAITEAAIAIKDATG